MAIGFGSSSSINRLDEMLGCEALTLSHVCSIKDGALRFFHVAREEESSRDRVCPIKNMYIYRPIWVWLLDLALHLQLRA